MDKAESLAELRQYAQWVSRRDHLVRQARQDGSTWSEIIDASGLSRQTIAKILAHNTTDKEN